MNMQQMIIQAQKMQRELQKKQAELREKEFTIVYKGEALEQKYIADFVCFDKIIVELKAVEDLLTIHTAQVPHICLVILVRWKKVLGKSSQAN